MATKSPPQPKYTGLIVQLPCINGMPPSDEFLMVDEYGTLYVPRKKNGVRSYMTISEIVQKFGKVIIKGTMKGV